MNEVKDGERCKHEEKHVIIGVGETEDRKEFVLKQCYECWNSWDEWREWELGGHEQ